MPSDKVAVLLVILAVFFVGGAIVSLASSIF
jgi:hypothetical protein